MRRNSKKPVYWLNNVVKQAQRKCLQGEPEKEKKRRENMKSASAEVFGFCMLIGANDKLGIGNTRLERVSKRAAERSEVMGREAADLIPRLVNGKKMAGYDLAEHHLSEEVKDYFPSDFCVPIYRIPSKKETAAVYQQRRAATVVAKMYALAFHEVLGFGPERIQKLLDAAADVYNTFREYAADGDYYGYAVIARRLGQIMHEDLRIEQVGETTPAFGDTVT